MSVSPTGHRYGSTSVFQIDPKFANRVLPPYCGAKYYIVVSGSHNFFTRDDRTDDRGMTVGVFPRNPRVNPSGHGTFSARVKCMGNRI